MTARTITTDAELTALRELMAGDNGHWCHRPTHILIDGAGAIRGAFSTAQAPILWFWMDSRHPDPIACARAYRLAEAAFRALGHRSIILPIEALSPFRGYMKAFGYEKLGECEIFEKEIG